MTHSSFRVDWKLQLNDFKFEPYFHPICKLYQYLQEKKPNNKCNGSIGVIQYFQCLPGKGLFTTIEKIVLTIPDTSEPATVSVTSELDHFLKKNLTNLSSSSNGISGRCCVFSAPLLVLNCDIVDNPPREEIVTKYGEYPKKLITASKNTPLNHNLRNSLSLQNIIDIDESSINTNNDFDQNTIIQPDRSQLMNVEKLKVRQCKCITMFFKIIWFKE